MLNKKSIFFSGLGSFTESEETKKELRIRFLQEKIRESGNPEDALTLAVHFLLGFDSKNGTVGIQFESLDFVMPEDVPQSNTQYIEMLKMASDLGHKAGSLALAKLYAGQSEDCQIAEIVDENIANYFLKLASEQGSKTAKDLLESGFRRFGPTNV